MFSDARILDDGSRIDADVAIIGSGPAGITIARALAGPDLKVCIVESGGLTPEAETQALYQGENAGIPYPLAATRLRQFGGTSGHWGGFCRPLDPIDFEARDWVPLSGWPFSRKALDPYWEAASVVVETAPARYEDPAYWVEKTGEPLVQWRGGRFMTRFFQFSPPTRFGQRYRAELEQSPDITVLLHANVTNIAALPSGAAVGHLDVKTLTGRRHRVHAKRYVLATGAIENARLLLLSNDVMPAGLGNQNDWVGRCFMEHPHLGGFAHVVVADPRRLPPIFRGQVPVDGRTARVAYVPHPDYLRRERRLSVSFTMSPVADLRAEGADVTAYTPANPTPADPGPSDLDQVKAAVAEQLDMVRAARPFLTDGGRPPQPDDPGYSGMQLGIGCACEPVPNPDSRVMLAADADALGLRRTLLDWRLTEQDRRSLVANIDVLGAELAAAGVGRMRPLLPHDGLWEAIVRGGSHHMGTTRMHDDPKRGVVDRNCRVHGIDNLYVAGSSVFPTAGSANPTLNIVALALRLVDHLKGQPA
ncbi:MAG: GMC family oxidoreductase [Thiohalocapsa sp.]|uniref:FAD-dependent oxidoreductase n=1 Tax=Thiohalocapsa sp. TaxID=2497641 RepID=UPI0025D996FE|nr:GMC family oxidoreductase [Thiohalocapsa sp.]MCG6941929.1 GMC family oxidoreductase [Thiohalocapsa sp.]